MNVKSEHVKLIWNRDNRTAVITVHYQDIDGCLHPKSGDQSFTMELKEAKDGWKDLAQMMISTANNPFPPRMRISNGKLLDLTLWVPLYDALSRFTEVIDLGLPLEPDE